ncbi:hydantoin utilization protein A [Aliishimia ponticola]|uniref:Hydantoin utilization protein A n=1 Tax=Aliishimia ponticola TaxID=2499833 RepID=A0A4S4N9W8_9RHOB|nr:HupE/UreJ family protein [Aliishimia ponticola]THH36056.1 hydantoin utilization protein A [Aliishimia ponticola]
MKLLAKSAAVAGLATLAAPAMAHHPLAGAPMETMAHGMLSGVGHPILGFDHLAFVVLVGIAAAFTGQSLKAPLGYVAGMLLGCLLMMAGVTLPFAEVVIGASLLVMGYVVLSGRQMSLQTVLLAFGAFGLFHGTAFGESIVGQEAGYGLGVAFGYLLGLGLTQYLIAVLAGIVMTKVVKATEATAIEARLAGAVIGGIGLFLTLENAEGAAFAALGLV